MESDLAKEFLDSVLAGMKAGLFVMDKNFQITTFTTRAERLTGFVKDEALTRTCYDVLQTSRCQECPLRLSHQVPEETLNYQTTVTNKSREKIPVDVTISPLRSSYGETIGAVGIIRDMTEQSRLWDGLRKERDKARQYLSIARVTIVALDISGRITLINKRGCEILGYEEDEIVGSNYFDVCIPEAIRAERKRVFRETMEGSDALKNCLEIPMLTKSGEERIIAWHHIALTDENGRTTGLLCSGEDVTERKVAQADMIRSEKLVAIGQLAAGVAHEVNNPLAGVLGYIKILMKKYKEETLQTEETEKQLLKIERATARSSQIIKDLLDFSRPSQPTLRPINVNEVVDATLSIVGHQIGLSNIDLEKELDAWIPPVVADFDQIQQALMNVILNAVQAMPDGGSLTIATSSVQDAKWGGSRRDAIRIDITDTGCGIPEENVEKIFTPFFSTKPKGKGVGLGLPAVQGIIEQHNGKIEVKSEIGEGTTVTMWLEAKNGKDDADTGRR
jgi:PAS domain S-box-containing protein